MTFQIIRSLDGFAEILAVELETGRTGRAGNDLIEVLIDKLLTEFRDSVDRIIHDLQHADHVGHFTGKEDREELVDRGDAGIQSVQIESNVTETFRAGGKGVCRFDEGTAEIDITFDLAVGDAFDEIAGKLSRKGGTGSGNVIVVNGEFQFGPLIAFRRFIRCDSFGSKGFDLFVGCGGDFDCDHGSDHCCSDQKTGDLFHIVPPVCM